MTHDKNMQVQKLVIDTQVSFIRGKTNVLPQSRRVLSNTATFEFKYFERLLLFHLQILLRQNGRRKDALAVCLRYDLLLELFRIIKNGFLNTLV